MSKLDKAYKRLENYARARQRTGCGYFERRMKGDKVKYQCALCPVNTSGICDALYEIKRLRGGEGNGK